MIPFEQTWPYEVIGKDVYVSECPFCRAENVLLPMKKDELIHIREGRKKLLVFPCCHGSVTLIDTDNDYLLAASKLRR
ncbi:hypothetical protein [Paenibacillus sp. y28]|uniref:hypothetical protein n=1 Tax=Paenibacillus sp. y28 TaxID=3129110 RepID=UPI0030161224